MAVADRLQRQHDAEQMRALLDSEAFATFQRHLHAEIDSALKRVLDTPLANVEDARGFYHGLRRALALPHSIIAMGKELN